MVAVERSLLFAIWGGRFIFGTYFADQITYKTWFMKRKPLILLEKLLLSLIMGMLTIMLADLLLRYFFDISLEIGLLILPFVGIGLVSLFVFFPRKKFFTGVILAIVFGFVMIFCNVTKEGVSGGSLINNSEYAIRVTPHSYWIVKYYPFVEKIIAKKKSDLFFDPDSKTGYARGYQVHAHKETADSLYIEINTDLQQLDSLKKRGLWEKN